MANANRNVIIVFVINHVIEVVSSSPDVHRSQHTVDKRQTENLPGVPQLAWRRGNAWVTEAMIPEPENEVGKASMVTVLLSQCNQQNNLGKGLVEDFM